MSNSPLLEVNMCWACHEQAESSYRACDGCSNLVEKQNLVVYDIIKEWGHIAEWIECKKNAVLFCANCKEAMDTYRESVRQHAQETEPYVWHHYGDRIKDGKMGAIPVGVHGNRQTLGIRCAQLTYGVNATEEILQGFLYRDDDDLIVRRVVIEEVDETKRCDKCWLTLWQCNAREVTR